MSLRCENLTIKNRREDIISSLNLSLPSGRISALYGPTGSGKTSLLLVFAGLMKPAAGTVYLDDMNILEQSSKTRSVVGLGLIPEFNELLSSLTLEENLILQARALRLKQPKQKVQEVINRFGLESERKLIVDNLPAVKNTEAGLAMALLGNPTTLLLDEPEYRLTTEETVKLWQHFQALKDSGKTIILTTRYQEVAARCDQVIYIPSGKVVDSHAFLRVSPVGTQTAFA